MANDIPFLGQGWGFPPEFTRSSHSVKMIAGEEDIRSSLEILLSTSIGERVMQPAYGADLKNCYLSRWIRDCAPTSRI